MAKKKNYEGIFRWGTPPAKKRKTKYDAAVVALKENPGEWAVVSQDTTSGASLATQIRNGRITAFQPKGSFDAETEAKGTNKDGKTIYDVWATYKAKKR